MDIRGEVEAPADLVPDALFAGRRRLRDDLADAKCGLRAALLRSTVGGRVGHSFDRKIGRARINVSGGGWSIDRDAFSLSADLSTIQSSMVFGRDIITLLSSLYGVSTGVVAARLLETIVGTSLDAETRQVIASQINKNYERKAST